MAKYPSYKYEFEISGQTVLMAVGETKQVGDLSVKVHKYSKGELMNTLWVSVDGGNWIYFEHGKRTPNGQERIDFKRYSVNYPQNAPKGNKIAETY